MERGPLRLKGSGGALGAAGKGEKTAKDKAQIPEQITGSKEQREEEEKRGLDKRTPAQVALEKMQEKQQMERIPEESVENPQGASGGVQQALGCSAWALRHPQTQ